MATKEYKIPLVWQMYGYIWVEAESEKEAIEIALGPEYPLPDNGGYVDDSLRFMMGRDKCETCLNSRVTVSENGYHSVCTLPSKKAVDCMLHGYKSYM